MRIKDYIYNKLIPKQDVIESIINLIESDENLDRTKCINFLKEAVISTQNVYLEAVNETLHLVESIDKQFLNREIPPLI
jgi:hypothetical protein